MLVLTRWYYIKTKESKRISMKSYNGFIAAQRQAAQNWINKQVEAGLLSWPTECCACRQTEAPIDFHAEDYSKPFGPHITQYPLCFRCHMALHFRFSSPEAWAFYAQHVIDGWRFEPFMTRNIGAFRSQFTKKSEGNKGKTRSTELAPLWSVAQRRTDV